MQVKIKVGENTQNHINILKERGYEVQTVVENGAEHYAVECAEHLDAGVAVDLNTDEGKQFVRDAVASHKMFGYRTQFILPGETEPRSGIFVVAKLGPLSAFVAKGEQPKPEKKDPVTEGMHNVLSDLGL
jgi:hypothetical protein